MAKSSDDDWSHITDPVEKRRRQLREAQRRHSKSLNSSCRAQIVFLVGCNDQVTFSIQILKVKVLHEPSCDNNRLIGMLFRASLSDGLKLHRLLHICRTAHTNYAKKILGWRETLVCGEMITNLPQYKDLLTKHCK
jgi:hypothetical protein